MAAEKGKLEIKIVWSAYKSIKRCQKWNKMNKSVAKERKLGEKKSQANLNKYFTMKTSITKLQTSQEKQMK